MLEKNSELRERYLKFSQEEKIHLFDEIQKNYFEKNKNLNTDFIGKMLKYVQINKKR